MICRIPSSFSLPFQVYLPLLYYPELYSMSLWHLLWKMLLLCLFFLFPAPCLLFHVVLPPSTVVWNLMFIGYNSTCFAFHISTNFICAAVWFTDSMSWFFSIFFTLILSVIFSFPKFSAVYSVSFARPLLLVSSLLTLPSSLWPIFVALIWVLMLIICLIFFLAFLHWCGSSIF